MGGSKKALYCACFATLLEAFIAYFGVILYEWKATNCTVSLLDFGLIVMYRLQLEATASDGSDNCNDPEVDDIGTPKQFAENKNENVKEATISLQMKSPIDLRNLPATVLNKLNEGSYIADNVVFDD